MIKILIIGQGGREHSLGFYLKKNPTIKKIFFAPGNGGTQEIGENISIKDIKDIIDFAEKEKIDLTIVGSEQYLIEGIVNEFMKKGLAIFGPDKQSAQLEGSKVFSKKFMQRHNIPTAKFKVYKDSKEAIQDLSTFQYPLVIKASGLAAGKGVYIVPSKSEAEKIILQMMEEDLFGQAGKNIVIEEFLEGYEVSLLSFFNGKDIFPMLTAKDHKKIGEGDVGLNTGGMGVIAPNSLIDKKTMEIIQKEIIQKTLNGLIKENLLFKGVIFFGLMVTKRGVFVLEYNLRMGDPETQTILPLLKSDLFLHIQQCMEGKTINFQWEHGTSCCVVTSSKGYPISSSKGDEIKGLEMLTTPYFIAGAKKVNNKIFTNGGRVLNVIAIGKNLQEARKKVYFEVKKIFYNGMYYRKDIGVF